MQWMKSDGLVPYQDAMAEMAARVKGVQDGTAEELLWLLEHPPLYTGGTSAKTADLVQPERFDVFETGRGGQYTYHGPGQRIAYLVTNLKQYAERRGGAPDLRLYVKQLEAWVIHTLSTFGVQGFLREGRVGVWVNTPSGEAKIAALGVRVQKWVTSHGIALNVSPDLSHYAGIVPCGISEYGVTSLHALGVHASMDEVDNALRASFAHVFGNMPIAS